MVSNLFKPSQEITEAKLNLNLTAHPILFLDANKKRGSLDYELTRWESWSPLTAFKSRSCIEQSLLLHKSFNQSSSLKYVEICKLEVENKIFKDLAISLRGVMFNQVYNKMSKNQQNTAIQKQDRENGSKPQQKLLKSFIRENCWLIVRAVKQWNGLPGQAKESPHLQAFNIVKFSGSEWLYVWSSLRRGGVRELQRKGWPFQIPSQSLGFSLPDHRHLEEGALRHWTICPSF